MVCLICNKKMKQINNVHLRAKHNMLPSEYEKKFGIKLSIYETNGKKISATLRKNHKAGKIKAWNKGLTKETDARVLKNANSLIGHAVSDKVKNRWIEVGRQAFIKFNKRNKNKPRRTIQHKCQTCDSIREFYGTEIYLKRCQEQYKFCRKCSSKIGARKTADTRLKNGSYINSEANFKKYKGGFRKDLGHYVRSKYEANYCRFLKFINEPYLYESKVFLLYKDKKPFGNYTPDFYLPNRDRWVELKGYPQSDRQKEKVPLFRKTGVKLRFLHQNSIYKSLARRYKSKILNWEK